ncbi:hypothetical protein Rhopal_006533-T1 [Rhodotorula paludigena]|uniref:RRM domain-containing protein n=1 Tax=Rhodotorula paludigena TaxID=86838 RepID=A0AAV5GVE9_9BASI|nr:hypothetical protein Rhopal_006533-T1 [Rhodotorula paludigena]
MNQVQAVKRLNEQVLALGEAAGSWHDQYKDSAYINVGGLPLNLTEGDVITIFSQYGEIVDINLPRDPNTGKPRGFAWLMYADQRSTILAVDNLNGASVLGRTLRVDHVLNYKQLERDQETGKMKEREEQSLAAHPDKFRHPAGGADAGSDAESDSSHPSIDLDDPMRDYLIEQKRAAKKKRRLEGGGEDKEEKRRRKEERRRIREERERKKERKAIAGSAAGADDGRRADRDGRRGDGERRRDGRERGGERLDDRRDERRRDARVERKRDDYGDERRRRDDYDERRRRDDDRDYRRRDERGDQRRGGSGGGGDAFADLERWARGQ